MIYLHSSLTTLEAECGVQESDGQSANTVSSVSTIHNQTQQLIRLRHNERQMDKYLIGKDRDEQYLINIEFHFIIKDF